MRRVIVVDPFPQGCPGYQTRMPCLSPCDSVSRRRVRVVARRRGLHLRPLEGISRGSWL